MEINLMKPNKSSPYYKLRFDGLMGLSLFYDSPTIKNYKNQESCITDLYFTKKELKELKDFLEELL